MRLEEILGLMRLMRSKRPVGTIEMSLYLVPATPRQCHKWVELEIEQKAYSQLKVVAATTSIVLH